MDTQQLLLQMTRLIAAHGVFALTAIFIFYQQSRAHSHLKGADPANRTYFRRVHAANLVATFALVIAASTVWWITNLKHRPVVWGVLTNLRMQPVEPRSAADQPRWQHQFVPKWPANAQFYQYAKEWPRLSGNFQVAWALRSADKMQSITFEFVQVYDRHRDGRDRSRPDARGTSSSSEHQVQRRASFTLDLEKLGYSPASPFELEYKLNEKDSISELGHLVLRQGTGTVRIPWDPEGPETTTGRATGLSGALLDLLIPSAYAQEAGASVFFGPEGEYSSDLGELLRQRLGSRHLDAQLEARRIVVSEGARSIRFIRESLAPEAYDGVDDRLALFQNLSGALDEIQSTGDRDYASVRLDLAMAIYEAGDFVFAAQLFDQIPESHFEENNLFYYRGYANWKSDRHEEALADLDKYLALTSSVYSRGFALELRGLILNEMERWKEAIAAYREAIELREEDAAARNNLAYLFAERGINLEEALELADQALEAEPANGNFLDTKGWVLYRLDRPEEALGYLQRALGIFPDDQEIKQHLDTLKVRPKG